MKKHCLKNTTDAITIKELYEQYKTPKEFQTLNISWAKINPNHYAHCSTSSSFQKTQISFQESNITFNSLYKGEFDYNLILIHEFFHFYYLYNYYHYPYNCHDELFFKIGNQFDSLFEKTERSRMGYSMNMRKIDRRAKYLKNLYSKYNYLLLEGYLFHNSYPEELESVIRYYILEIQLNTKKETKKDKIRLEIEQQLIDMAKPKPKVCLMYSSREII